MPDAVLLTEVAILVDRHAEVLRRSAVELVRSTGGCEWDGPAARRFRADAGPLLYELRVVSHRLSEAAAVLRRNAR